MDYSEVIKRVKDSIVAVIDFDDKNEISGHGTGFVYQRSDIVVTCNHVVDSDKPFVWFRTTDEKPVTAQVVTRNIEHDIAILKIDAKGKKPLTRFKGEVVPGMPVLFPGYPFEYTSLTSHQGILSSVTEDESGLKNYSIDGTVNSGNSGGPLLTKDGELFGIVNAGRRVNMKVIKQIRGLSENHMAVGGLDITKVLKTLVSNLQLGIGYAIPDEYIPSYTGPSMKDKKKVEK